MAGRIGIIGGGPAGLMAAEAASGQGREVIVFDAMPSLGRKLLMAGKSGLNITHAEPFPLFSKRYGAAQSRLMEALADFDNKAVVEWCRSLGIETFSGSSQRVFPAQMKASPLLRAWLARLAAQGVQFRVRHRLIGAEDKKLVFETADGEVEEQVDAVILAMGGASWPRLGSDARWVPLFQQLGVKVVPFRPANCGFERSWSSVFIERFAGQPVKTVTARSSAGVIAGEFVITRWGVEGSLVYAQAAALRDALEEGTAELVLDLVPGRSIERLTQDIGRQASKTSFSNRLRKAAGIEGVKLGLVREVAPEATNMSPLELAKLIKSLPLGVERPRPMEEAISVAGGIAWGDLDQSLMLKAMPGWFAAGEMVDWEAPTGGYLLTACLATGKKAGLAAAAYVAD